MSQSSSPRSSPQPSLPQSPPKMPQSPPKMPPQVPPSMPPMSLDMDDLENEPTPVEPENLQEQLLEEIEELQTTIQKMETMYEEKLKESETHIRSKQEEYLSVPKTKETVDMMTKKLKEKGVSEETARAKAVELYINKLVEAKKAKVKKDYDVEMNRLLGEVHKREAMLRDINQ